MLLAAAVLVGGCGEPPPATPAAPELAARFELLANEDAQFHARLTLINRGPAELGTAGWALYFNLARQLVALPEEAGLAAEHLDGDLWRLVPRPSFEPLSPGGERQILLSGGGHLVRRSDAPRGLYLVWRAGGVETARELGEVSVAPFDQPQQTRRGSQDQMPVPTPASRYRDNRSLGLLPAGELTPLVPTPRELRRGAGQVVVDGSWTITHDSGFEAEAAALAVELGRLVGGELSVGQGSGAGAGTIRLARRAAPPEHYRLSVDPAGGIELAAADAAGIFYAGRSLLGLTPPAAWAAEPGPLTLPAVNIDDGPRFAYRGLHLDVARNFQTPETVRRLIDLAAFYKLNRLHLHLADDEGWRLEVPALPELTAVGGRRGHTLDEADRLLPSLGSGPTADHLPGSGFYTGEQFVEILRHARARHVQVVTEIDLPGHARAAIKAMEARAARLRDTDPEAADRYRLLDPGDSSTYRSVQGWTGNVVDVCLPSTYRFIEVVVDEIVALYQRAGAPLEMVHIGGDEVPHGAWEGSPACARRIAELPELGGVEDLPGHFVRRVERLLAERGLATAGWEEVALRAAPGAGESSKLPDPELAERGVVPYVWNSVWGWGSEDLAYRLANAGFEVVLCNASNLYFDLAYEKHPEEPGLDWAGFVDTRTAWELVPFDLYRSARVDRLGRPVRAEQLAASARLEPAARRRVLGLQGQLWGENLTSPQRLDFMAFPKLLGLAERAWAPAPRWAGVDAPAARDRQRADAWNEFANRLGQRELARLDFAYGGVDYRLPPPGAVIEAGRLLANSAFPGLEIRWVAGSGEVPPDARPYTGPVAVEGPVSVAVFDRRGRTSRPSVVGAAPAVD